MPKIQEISGREILDSRGRPTVEATCILASGSRAVASVPSGASTGKAEAVELRDGAPQRYKGLGCRQAARNVSGELNERVSGRDFALHADFDRLLIACDGTPAKSRLGANALVAASVAFACSTAAERRVRYGDTSRRSPARRPTPSHDSLSIFSAAANTPASRWRFRTS